MPDLDEHLKEMAERIADGHTPDWGELGGDSAAEVNLRKIMQLSEAFQQAREQAGDPGLRPQFRWCHLDVFEQIGAGGFGNVHRAFDRVLDREVALKLRRRSGNDDPMIQEARRLARVRHPNVLAVHGADIDDGRAGIWCDLLQGQTLEQLLKAGQRAQGKRLLSICLDLTGAVLAIHLNDLTHGDIKASNVMLQPDGTPVLMDFGAAADQSGPTASPLHGSPLVMAPELLDSAPSSEKTDIYSLGVLFFRLCCGRYPIAGSGMEALKAAHREHQRLDFSGVERPLRKVLAAMLSPDPTLRPTARQTLAALTRLAARPQVRRRRLAVSAVIAALILGSAAMALGFYQARQAASEARLAQAEAQQSLQFLTDVLAAPQGRNEGAEVKVVDVIDSARSELTFAPPESTRQHAIMAHTLGITYKALGAHEQAEDLLTLAMQKWDELGTSDHELARLQTLLDLGASLSLRGKLEESKAMLQQVLDQLLGNSPQEQHLRAATFHFLSAVVDDQGDELERDRLLEQALLALPVVDASNTLRATIALDQARYLIRTDPEAAEKTVLSARNWLKRAGGTESFTMYQSDHILAMVLLELGDFTAAETLLRDSQARAQSRYGKFSEIRLGLLHLLSSTLSRRGQDAEALAMEIEVTDAVTAVYGSRHSNTMMQRNNLAIRYQYIGQLEQAIAIYRQVAAIFAEDFAEDHPQRLLTLGNLAEALLDSGQFEEAEAVARDAYTADLKKFGPDHIVTLFAADVLGAALTRQGKFDEALVLLRQTHGVKVSQFGVNNPYTHDSAFFLAEALLKSDQPGAATALLEGVVESRSSDLGQDHKKTREAAALLALAAEG